jgi:hypothetical protein
MLVGRRILLLAESERGLRGSGDGDAGVDLLRRARNGTRRSKARGRWRFVWHELHVYRRLDELPDVSPAILGVVARSPFAQVLHEEAIAKLARGSVLARGRAYVDRVSDLSMQSARLTACVRGTSVHAVSIWVSGDRLGYACTCPAGVEGAFCKHCVAVALRWVGQRSN